MPETFPSAVAVEKGFNGREFIAIMRYCMEARIGLRVLDAEKVTSDMLPVGSVFFIERCLGYKVVPDYYPSWCTDILHRKVWWSPNIPTKACFVKPDQYKIFTGYVKKQGTIHNCHDTLGFWCSEIVTFEDEWRYLVSDGKVLDASWYQGKNEDSKAPEMPVIVPRGTFGALDIGRLDDGRLALVEFHHPFSVGWYGDQQKYKAYARFLIDGWTSLKNEEGH